MRAKVIRRTAAEQHVAGDPPIGTVGALGLGVGVVGKLAALVAAVQVELPWAFGVTHAEGAFVLGREGHTVAFVRAVFADGRVDIGVGGVHIETGQRRAQAVEGIVDARLDALVARFTTGNHRVVGLVAVVLVVEVDQERADLRTQGAVVITCAELPGAGFFRLHFAAVHAVGHLAVLHAAERAFGVGVEVPVVGEVVEHVQCRQCGVVVALVFDVAQVVGLLGLDHLVADARGDGPLADINAVVDEERVGFGAAARVAVVAAVGGRDLLVGGNRRAVAQFVAGFIDVAVADAHFMAGRAEVEALGEAGFQAAYPIFAGR